MLLECGFVKPISGIRLYDKDSLVRTLCLHHMILKSKAELDQLKEGLGTLGVATAMESMPDVFIHLFTSNEDNSQLTPGIIFVSTVLCFSFGIVIKNRKIQRFIWQPHYLFCK